jgi:hypothetical protein
MGRCGLGLAAAPAAAPAAAAAGGPASTPVAQALARSPALLLMLSICPISLVNCFRCCADQPWAECTRARCLRSTRKEHTGLGLRAQLRYAGAKQTQEQEGTICGGGAVGEQCCTC